MSSQEPSEPAAAVVVDCPSELPESALLLPSSAQSDLEKALVEAGSAARFFLDYQSVNYMGRYEKTTMRVLVAHVQAWCEMLLENLGAADPKDN